MSTLTEKKKEVVYSLLPSELQEHRDIPVSLLSALYKPYFEEWVLFSGAWAVLEAYGRGFDKGVLPEFNTYIEKKFVSASVRTFYSRVHLRMPSMASTTLAVLSRSKQKDVSSIYFDHLTYALVAWILDRLEYSQDEEPLLEGVADLWLSIVKMAEPFSER